MQQNFDSTFVYMMISRQKRQVVNDHCSIKTLTAVVNMKAFIFLVTATIIAATTMIICGFFNNPIEIYYSKARGLIERPQNSLLKNWTNCMLKNADIFNGSAEKLPRPAPETRPTPAPAEKLLVGIIFDDLRVVPVSSGKLRAWNNGWGTIINKCEKESLPRLNVSAFHNSDETKYHILPRQKWKSTVVTLGIGRDTAAENGLRQAIGKENIEFFGADPIYAENEELYSKIGKYFPFAVSATAGYSSASVLLNGAYVDKSVVNVDLVYFLTKIVNRTFFDAIWMDAEHAEYGLFPTMLKGGGLDQNGVVVCQWNMEIHSPDAAKKNLTYHFLLQTVRDARYASLKPVRGNHLRLFFLNFEDKRCLEKYLP